MATYTRRNDKCPCGSGKKYKRCYTLKDVGCAIFLKEKRKMMLAEHDKREKEVFNFLNQISIETTVIDIKDKNQNDSIPLRIQMIIIFSLIDVLGSYWYIYLDKTGKTNERATSWYDTYCASERNEHYVGKWKELTSTRLYVFRNALVHFFGMGEQRDGQISIALVENGLPNSELDVLEQGLLARGRNTIGIRPRDFSNIVKAGAIRMLKDWARTITLAQSSLEIEKDYINAIERVWRKVRQEGAVGIAKKK